MLYQIYETDKPECLLLKTNNIILTTKCRIAHGLQIVYQYKCQLFHFICIESSESRDTHFNFGFFSTLSETEKKANQKHILCKLFGSCVELEYKVAAHAKNIYGT